MKAASIRHASCEKDFVYKSIKNGIRLDGRQSYDYRNLNVIYGLDYGCCEVLLGDSRAIAQTSCELVKPKETRPTEGELYVNVELSPMASPAFENGRPSEYSVEINRLLERCLKEAKAIDVESLCLIAGEKVWAVRVDVLVLNDAGNLIDLSCIAAISALSHFRRPDVTVSSTDVTIHTCDEKEFLPLNVHHIPICTTFGFVDNGEQVIIDPEEKEEDVISGRFTVAFNIHNEICCAQMSGGVAIDYEQILQCAKIASIKAGDITDVVKAALEEDTIRRTPAPTVKRPGLKDPVTAPTLESAKNSTDIPKIELVKDSVPVSTPQSITHTVAQATKEVLTDIAQNLENGKPMEVDTDSLKPVENLGRGTALIGDGKPSAWSYSDSENDEDTNENMGNLHKKNVKNKKTSKEKTSQELPLNDDSEEEDSVQLLSTDLNGLTTSKPVDTGEIKDEEDNPLNNVNNQNNNQIETHQTEIKSNQQKKKKKKKRKLNVTT